ncbi:hypothetical protein [Bordetella avium]|uniref:Membrane protein n=1 Tax=Bordetella avium (strain 197N) TaxID=360910 RepID=Q2KYD9_BORA1|nr:hypothetical protein [Bordetella avium]AZY49648.1 hypothetical protein C0J09_11245 [Bordetella avium]AZY53001.1 hypothetical protein C0J07_11225 [Bordetella avium]RIQ11997.1 hypothetical protein D0432_15155 [Bordetella avium]RIQ17696.1 hypothetical protein D0850_09535 [Bordetella avium]RIQ32353.1 hypothetical protein D0849_12580 [Bordetella avium]
MVSCVENGAALLLAPALRWLAWLNSMASLLLAAFSLGIVGAEVAPTDLSWPLSCFLAGVLAVALAYLLFAATQALRGKTWLFWPVLGVAVASYGVAVLGFAAGCWLTLGDASAIPDGGWS